MVRAVLQSDDNRCHVFVLISAESSLVQNCRHVRGKEVGFTLEEMSRTHEEVEFRIFPPFLGCSIETLAISRFPCHVLQVFLLKISNASYVLRLYINLALTAFLSEPLLCA